MRQQHRDLSGRHVHHEEPANLESPFSGLEGLITPVEQFYVRCHFPIPRLDAATWLLRVEGAVRRSFDLDFDAIRGLPARTVLVTLECAGNGRRYLGGARGVQWSLGAVGTAEWTGLPLAAVLEAARVRPEAVDVLLEGADGGELEDEPRPWGPVRFARSLPLRKATQPDVLLAYAMNGRELPPEHGHPLRAIVPGWYGMASIKSRVVVTDQPFRGYYESVDCSAFERRHGAPAQVPITRIQVKAQIARPTNHEVVPANRAYRVHGAAWAGDGEVAEVAISADGGAEWTPAQLLGDPLPNTWRLWEHTWQVPARAGWQTLMARATDREGRQQPLEHDRDRGRYMINHVLPVDVEVR